MNVSSRSAFASPPRRGFTLIELLASVATIGVLAVLCVGVAKKAITCATRTKEVNAARILVTALQASAADSGGSYLAGMDMRANTSTNPVLKPDGQPVSNVRAAQRYPFRLAPYLGDRFDGTVLVNRNKTEILKKTGGTGSQYDYEVSAYPALGMNVFGVGGVVTRDPVSNDDVTLYGADCISRSSQTEAGILAFASAGVGTGSARMSGYCYVAPPTMETDSPVTQKWDAVESWKASADPMKFGFVDFRYDGKAVCAFLDGSVRLCSVEELRDMRRWSRGAAAADNPDYTMTP